MAVKGVTNSFLIISEGHYLGKKYILGTINLIKVIDGEVTSPRKKYIIDVLLNGHEVKLSSRYGYP